MYGSLVRRCRRSGDLVCSISHRAGTSTGAAFGRQFLLPNIGTSAENRYRSMHANLRETRAMLVLSMPLRRFLAADLPPARRWAGFLTAPLHNPDVVWCLRHDCSRDPENDTAVDHGSRACKRRRFHRIPA
jgi:hypothetical protein